MQEEDREIGKVRWFVYMKYFQYGGGFWLLLSLFIIFVLWITLRNGSDIFI